MLAVPGNIRVLVSVTLKNPCFPCFPVLNCLWICFLDKGHERPPGILVHRCEEHGDVGRTPSPRYPNIKDLALSGGVSCTVAETGSALTTNSVQILLKWGLGEEGKNYFSDACTED